MTTKPKMLYLVTHEPTSRRYVHHNENWSMVRNHQNHYAPFPPHVIAESVPACGRCGGGR